jgi:uncharacterized protein (DUF2141 family)
LKETILVLLITFYSGLSNTASLTLKVTNFKSQEGNLLIYLCDTEKCHHDIEEIQKTKDTTRALYKKIKIAKSDPTTVKIENLRPGKYSAFCLHDENNDEIPNFTLFVPDEPFGISRLTSVPLSKPNFSDSSIELIDEQSEVEIEIPLLRALDPFAHNENQSKVNLSFKRKLEFLEDLNRTYKGPCPF